METEKEICEAAMSWLAETIHDITECEPNDSQIRNYLPEMHILIDYAALSRNSIIKRGSTAHYVQYLKTCCINLNEIFKEDCSYLTDFETILNK